MDRSNSMSLTVLVIILAMLGLLVGYLLGNWFIQLVTGESPDISRLADSGNKVVEEEIVLDDNEAEESASENYILDPSPQKKEENNTNNLMSSNIRTEDQIRSEEVFVIQVGAFNSLQNAKQLSDNLKDKGFQVVIADESLPYKVQIGAFPNRDKAEEMEEKVKDLGYDAFITH